MFLKFPVPNRLFPRWFLPCLGLLSLRLMADETAALHSLDQPDPARDARVAWHTEARFGCFVHWGVYSELGNEFEGRRGGTYAEHIMRVLKIPRQVYLDQVVRNFDPEKFDADVWVKLMHDAGMRYLVITAKHHDGFAMWPSKVSSYNITLTKFKRDPMAELKAACAKYGLKFGFYYSHAFDWEHPDAPGNDWDYNNPGGDRKIHGAEWWNEDKDFLVRARHYVDEKSIPQIKELIAMYHPDILWFDTPGKLPPEENRRILEAVRAAGPQVVVNGRLLRDYGDYKSTADRPAYFPDTPGHWEGIPTTNESYGYNQFDQSFKPPAHFIRLLAMAVAKGGNILMNIGPKGDGTIDVPSQEILRGIGAWMQKNSESIYGCDRTPLSVQNWGTSTRKGNKLYLHVFSWPADGRLLVAGLKSDPQSIRVLGTAPADVAPSFHRLNADDAEIQLTQAAPDQTDSVVELDFKEDIATNPARLILSHEVTALHVFDGWLHGQGIAYGDGKRARDVVETWNLPDSAVKWKVRLSAPERFRVAVEYNTAKGSVGGTFTIEAGDQVLTGQVEPTENTTAFRTAAVGEISLPAGEFILAVRAKAVSGGDLMRLRQLEFTPIEIKPGKS
ncbi:MAG TPA: alpha-L-fucosidase [Opitutaceae bacterium]|jgi:alpha-L-fucosidase|nr:alpha-L-fucosidase [Opitutaceae bacterium]